MYVCIYIYMYAFKTTNTYKIIYAVLKNPIIKKIHTKTMEFTN
jgi:hypothetical protein